MSKKLEELEQRVKVLEDYIEIMRQQTLPWVTPLQLPIKQGCSVCGIGAKGEAIGYVCTRHDCPTRITCGVIQNV